MLVLPVPALLVNGLIWCVTRHVRLLSPGAVRFTHVGIWFTAANPPLCEHTMIHSSVLLGLGTAVLELLPRELPWMFFWDVSAGQRTHPAE